MYNGTSSIRVKIMNIFIVLKKLKNHIKPKKYSSINLISSSLSLDIHLNGFSCIAVSVLTEDTEAAVD